MKLSLVLAASLLLMGCAAKRRVGVDFVVPKECVLSDPILKDCNPDRVATTPQCRAIVLKFKAGCEKVTLQTK